MRYALGALLLAFALWGLVAKGLGWFGGQPARLELRLGSEGMRIVEGDTGAPFAGAPEQVTGELLRELGGRIGEGEWAPVLGLSANDSELFFGGRVRLQLEGGVPAARLVAELRAFAEPTVGLWRYRLVCGDITLPVWVPQQFRANDYDNRYTDLTLVAVRRRPDGRLTASIEVCTVTAQGNALAAEGTTRDVLDADRTPSEVLDAESLASFSTSVPIAAEPDIDACDLVRYLSGLGLEERDLELCLVEFPLVGR